MVKTKTEKHSAPGLLVSVRIHHRSSTSEYLAEDLATDILLARLMVCHDALRRGKDGNAKTIGHMRDGFRRNIDAAARLGDARNFTHNRLAVEILQFDRKLRLAVVEVDLAVVADIAFRLQHVEDTGAQPRAGRRHRRLPAPIGMADAGMHIAARLGQGQLRSALP